MAEFGTLDRGAALATARAAWLGRRSDDEPPLISFTSLFLALAWGNDSLARWIRTTAGELELDWDHVLARWSSRHRMPPRTVDDLERARALAPAELDPGQAHLPSPSAGAIGSAAVRIAKATGAARVDTRHLFAAYLFDATVHTEDCDAWGLDREAWKRRFVQQLAVWRSDDLECWLDAADLGDAYAHGMQDVLHRAAAAAPPRTIDALVLLDALVLEGAQYPKAGYIATWLCQRVGATRVAQAAARLGQVASEPPPAHPVVPWRELALDGDARAALTIAKLIGITGMTGQAHTRHMLAALLASPSAALIDALGDDLSAGGLLAEIRGRIARNSPDEAAAWDRVLDRHEIRMAGYAADRTAWPVGPDLLEIERDVNGLAAVIASRDVSPPLSIGLLGNWGTGKSFFLAKLRDRIIELAKLGGTAGSSYHAEICQIEFNAWHYVDVDLWASLATRIWNELATRVKLAELRDSFRAVTERRSELTQEAQTAKRRSDEASGALIAARERQVSALTTLEAAIKQSTGIAEARARALNALGLGPDAQVDLKQQLARLGTIQGRLAVWWNKRTLADWMLAAAVLAVVAMAAALWDQLGSLAGRLSGPLAAVLAVVVRIVQRADGATATLDGYLERTRQIEDSVRAPAVAAAQVAVDRAGAEVQQTQAKLDEIIQEQARIQAELARIDEAPDMRRLVLERARSDDYRKHLGLISTLHRDFEDLSKALAPPPPPKPGAAPAAPDKPRPCDRVVLYIDDLDRCPPRRVVEVLQAVHLLLSLELFVVVVAVDARWLLQSLEDYFARQFRTRRSEDSPHVDTPLHYLEKIFQIPLALKPVRGGGFTRMIESMVGKAAPDEPPQPSPSEPAPSRAPRAGNGAPPAPPAAVAPRPAAPPSPAPRSLKLGPDEIRRLIVASDLMTSPRTAKRLVNLYRIVRAGVTDGELDDFVARSAGPIQLCLAIVVGKPALATELFTAIFEGRCDSHAALLAFVRARAGLPDPSAAEAQPADAPPPGLRANAHPADAPRAAPPPANAPPSQATADWRTILTLLEDRRFLDPTDWAAVRDAAAHTARFSFQTSRVLQTLGAARDPADATRTSRA